MSDRTASGAPRGSALRLSIAISAIVLTLLPACGRKTNPKGAELVRPEQITSLEATVAATGVKLSWKRPDDYADGSNMPDLGTFTIQRADGDGQFHSIESLGVTDRERFRKIRRLHYTDTTVTAGTRYRYRILSTTLDDYESEPSNVAEIITP